MLRSSTAILMDKHQLRTESQYGFRLNRPTLIAIIESIEESGIDHKNDVMGYLLILKKAFDTIDHDILINKLERYGIRG